MKIFAILYALFAFQADVAAQAFESTIDFDKKKQEAIQINYPFSTDAVEKAIIDKFNKMGYKSKEEKGMFNKDRGFIIFKNAYVTEISPERMDYVVKIERKSRKESDETVLYLLLFVDDKNVMPNMGETGKT